MFHNISNSVMGRQNVSEPQADLDEFGRPKNEQYSDMIARLKKDLKDIEDREKVI